jgi:hypothetical protein
MRVLSGLGLSAVAAAGLFLFDGVAVGQGVLSLLVLAFVAVAGLPSLYLARTDTDLFVLRAKKTVLFALAAAAALLFVRFNTRLAARRAEALITACESYREANSRYPDRLADLAPRFIANIPKAKLTWRQAEFFYRAGDTHVLGWTTMPPFGQRFFVLEEKRWGQSD